MKNARSVRVSGSVLLFGVIVLGGRLTSPVASPRLQAEARTVSASVGAESAPTKNKPRAFAAYGSVPLSFEPNRGQTDPRVKFLSRGSGYTNTFFHPPEQPLAGYISNLEETGHHEPKGQPSDTRLSRHVV